MAVLYLRVAEVSLKHIKWMRSCSGVQLRVTPSTCFFDEAVQVKLSGLSPHQLVNFQSSHTDDNREVFKSTATYLADETGVVDLSHHPSLAGSYTGVEPMGLFWSMLPQTPHKKLLKRDASSPVCIEIQAGSGGQILAKETHQRRFMADGVRRVPVKHNRLRGTLFIPPGEGPFPGIIDLYMLGGTVCEPRAALLANKGFVVFALAFYGHQDMPKMVDKLDLHYFEEATTFLQMQPEVKKSGLGILSFSKGGDLALSMASFLPNISATVCINTCNANVLFPLHYRDMVIPALTGSTQNIPITKSGLMNIRDALPDPNVKENLPTIIPIERAECSFLFIVSGDDWNWNSTLFAEQACSRLKAHGKNKFEKVFYPKAGHFIEVPYMPHYPSGLHLAVGGVVAFGGEPKANAEAQVDAWGRIQEFFCKHV